ncbi:MAG: sulfite exporter TauE/SafE family protein [Candidatus Aminicenantes bacterium]|nr:sulfite exporter TauE/SafE family protein [Candidatus Aminicenantes bacterium]
MSHVMVVAVIFVLTVVMIMSGRGGGNFYVAALVLSGVAMHAASTTSQFILLASALMGAVVFGKARTLSWPLVLFFGGVTASLAFFGGFFAHRFGGTTLKIVLSVLLFIAGAAMLFPEKQGKKTAVSRPGFWNIRKGGDLYVVNLWLALPLAMATGFFSGMVGISGGSFLVPLMVVGCGVPMRTAVGTASAMLAATALTGFAGNALHGGFVPELAVPCGAVALVGGLIGGKIALKTKPLILKNISGILTIIAAIFMLANALSGR